MLNWIIVPFHKGLIKVVRDPILESGLFYNLFNGLCIVFLCKNANMKKMLKALLMVLVWCDFQIQPLGTFGDIHWNFRKVNYSFLNVLHTHTHTHTLQKFLKKFGIILFAFAFPGVIFPILLQFKCPANCINVWVACSLQLFCFVFNQFISCNIKIWIKFRLNFQLKHWVYLKQNDVIFIYNYYFIIPEACQESNQIHSIVPLNIKALHWIVPQRLLNKCHSVTELFTIWIANY